MLSAYCRKNRIERTLTLLSVIEKKSIEKVCREDLEKIYKFYQAQDKKENAKSSLLALFSVIANGIGIGILKRNPFDDLQIEPRKKKARNDFVMPDQIAKLQDMNSLNWTNLKEVRGRCLTHLIYDVGLRASAVAKLKLEDVTELLDGRYQFLIKGKYLKGDKEDKIIYMIFPETVRLLRQWIDTARLKLNAKTSHLFISLKGNPLTTSGVREIVRHCCNDLNLLTVKGKVPSPHTFRHTLSILNISPYGKSLAPRLMQSRLGHADFETFEKGYVHHNPLAEMEEYKKIYNRNSEEAILPNSKTKEVLGASFSVKAKSAENVKKYRETAMHTSEYPKMGF